MNIGLLLLRLVVGGLMFGHGTQKLFGWFGGHGPDGTASFFGSLGFRRPRTMAILAGTGEAAAGAGLALGLLTPLAGAVLIGVMLVATLAVHLDNGLWNTNGGYEYNLVLATVGATLAFTGAGTYAIDEAIGWGLDGAFWGITAIVLGVAAGALVLTQHRTPVGAEQSTPAEEDEAAEERVAA